MYDKHLKTSMWGILQIHKINKASGTSTDRHNIRVEVQTTPKTTVALKLTSLAAGNATGAG